LEKAEPRELSRLRLVDVGGSVETPHLPLLRKLAEANPDVAIHTCSSLKTLLSLFRPRWLVLDKENVLDQETLERLAGLRNLEGLCWEGLEAADVGFLERLAGLRALNLLYKSPRKPVSGPRRLDRLEFFTASDIPMSLFASTRLDRLERIRLIDATPEDLRVLGGFKGLRALSLSQCKQPVDLDPLKDMQNLEFIGFPQLITPGDLSRFVSTHRRLKRVELIKCGNIKDVSSLLDLPDLEQLVLIGKEVDLAPLGRMKNLRLLVLGEETFTKSEETIQALRKALPGCAIVAGEGICLGSGWILLLVPAAIAASRFPRRRSA
jgi:hypothetical protein